MVTWAGSRLAGNAACVARSEADARPGIWPSAVELIDAAPNAMLLLDHQLVVLHGNARAREALGTVRIGEHVSRSSRHPELTQALGRIQAGEPNATFEMQVRGPVERHLQGTATRLVSHSQRGERDTVSTILLVLQDISERDALGRMRMEFVANASHELRTPLASLSGFIETLQGPAKDDPNARERFLGDHGRAGCPHAAADRRSLAA